MWRIPIVFIVGNLNMCRTVCPHHITTKEHSSLHSPSAYKRMNMKMTNINSFISCFILAISISFSFSLTLFFSLSLSISPSRTFSRFVRHTRKTAVVFLEFNGNVNRNGTERNDPKHMNWKVSCRYTVRKTAFIALQFNWNFRIGMNIPVKCQRYFIQL